MANKKIRGITVEIGGDVTKLDKALAGSEKQSRSLQVELREIDKLLKFDPTNTELLTQKQSALKDMISETAKKLDTLKEAEAQVIAQFERGEIAEDQLRAFQREIMQTEKALDGMKDDLSAVDTALKNVADGTDTAEKHTQEYRDSVEKAKKDLEDFGEKAEASLDKVKVGAKALGGAIVGALGGAGFIAKASIDFDKALNTLITKTGASADEVDELNASMENVYSNNFGESIEDVANSMATVKTQTGLAGKELESVTSNALLMRDTFDFEVNESIRAVNSLMDQFGITADEAYNLIAQGAQKGLNQNDDLMDVINEYSVHFQNAGYSAEDMFNMLSNGVEQGTWSVDKLGDAVKEFNIRMSDGSAKEAVEALGFSWDQVMEDWSKGGEDASFVLNMLMTEMSGLAGTTEGYNAGVGLLGTMFEDLGYDAVYALSQTNGEISKTSDALESINDTKYDDIGSALQGLGRTLETDLINPIGEELTPVVSDVIDTIQENAPEIKEVITNVVDKVGEFVTFVSDNGDAIISVIAGIGAGLLIWNVVSMITGVVNAIKAFKLANEGATIAQWAMNVAMNANPIGILVTVIGAIVVALITFIATNEDARAKIVEVWEKIKETFGNVIDAIVKFFTETIPEAFSGFIETATGFFEKVKGFFTGIIDFIKNNWQGLLLLIVNPFAGAFKLAYDNCEGFREFVDTFIENIKNFFINAGQEISDFFTTTIPNLINSVIEKFELWLTDLKNFFVNIGNSISEFFTTTIPNLIDSIGEWFAQLPEKIGYAIGFTIGKLILWYNNIKEWVTTEVPKIIDNVVTFFKELPSKIYNSILDTVNRIETWGTEVKEKATTVVTAMIDKVVLFFKVLPSKISDAISGAIDRVTEWGTNLKEKAVTAINNLLKSVESKAKEIPGKISNAISSAIDKISAWGTKMKNKASTAINNLVTSVTTKAKELPGKISSAISKAIDKVVAWGTKMKEKAVSGMKKVIDGISNAFKKVPEKMKDIGKNIVEGIWNGIKHATSWIKEKVGDFAKGILDGMKDALGIKSPSREFRDQVGRFIAEGIGVGIEENADSPLQALENLGDDMINGGKKINGLTLNRQLEHTFTNNMSSGGSVADLVNLVSEYFPKLIEASNKSIYLNGKTLVGETINDIDNALGTIYSMKARGT